MKIHVGQVFRVSQNEDRVQDHVPYSRLTRGSQGSSADINKGIWAYKAVSDPYGVSRRPAVLLLSNQLETGTELNPWLDIIEPDEGYALYHGDNRSPERDPFEARGNKLLGELRSMYDDPKKRSLAPPLLLFEQEMVDGRRKGYRRFAGFGVPRSYRIETQGLGREPTRFTNLVVEMVLFGLEAESEQFDWTWIDKRRDPSKSAIDALRSAPASWKRWVRDGEAGFDRCRRRVSRRRIAKRAEQLDMPKSDRSLLEKVYSYYAHDRHSFEGLASFAAQRTIGDRCERGWVTKRSGDGGIDFVSRLDVAAGFSRTSAVVLGQAKCVKLDSAVGGKDVARVVARLRRGWIGAFVSTGYFSEAAQAELYDDEYPIVMINGKQLAATLQKELALAGIGLETLMAREDSWYASHLERLEPQRILHGGYGQVKLTDPRSWAEE